MIGLRSAFLAELVSENHSPSGFERIKSWRVSWTCRNKHLNPASECGHEAIWIKCLAPLPLVSFLAVSKLILDFGRRCVDSIQRTKRLPKQYTSGFLNSDFWNLYDPFALSKIQKTKPFKELNTRMSISR